jgi:hypothetical protein
MKSKKRPTQPPPRSTTQASKGPESHPEVLRRLAENPAYQQIMAMYLFPPSAKQLAEKITQGVLQMLGIKCDDAGIHPLRLASFLAILQEAKAPDLPQEVARGLRALGISRTLPKRGRPRGRVEKAYGVAHKVISEVAAPLWRRKSELQKASWRRWEETLRTELAAQGYAGSAVNALVDAQTERQFVTALVAAHFDVECETAERGIRRAAKQLL